MTVVSLARIGACHRWRRPSGPARAEDERPGPLATVDPTRIARWEQAHVVIAAVTGLVWSSLVLLVAPDNERNAILVGFTLTTSLVLARGSFTAHRLPLLVFHAAGRRRAAHQPAAAAGRAARRGRLRLAGPDRDPLLHAAHRVAGSFATTCSRGSSRSDARPRQAAFVETAPLGILVVRDQRIVVSNDAFVRILGYSRKEELVGQSVADGVPGRRRVAPGRRGRRAGARRAGAAAGRPPPAARRPGDRPDAQHRGGARIARRGGVRRHLRGRPGSARHRRRVPTRGPDAAAGVRVRRRRHRDRQRRHHRAGQPGPVGSGRRAGRPPRRTRVANDLRGPARVGPRSSGASSASATR